MEPGELRWVDGGRGFVVYRVTSALPDPAVDILHVHANGMTIDGLWDSPLAARYLGRLARIGRLIEYDQRGVGSRIHSPPTLRTWAATRQP